MTSQGAGAGRVVGRRIASGLLVVLGLLAASAGLGLTLDDCEVACGSDGEQRFREVMGYLTLLLGLATAVLALLARRWVAVGTFVLAASCWLAGIIEALSHLS